MAHPTAMPELGVDPKLSANAGAMIQGNQNTQNNQSNDQQIDESRMPHWRTYDDAGRRWPIRESRIKDRPNYTDATQGSVKIKVELDLEVEVDLYARVKGDVTVGLM